MRLWTPPTAFPRALSTRLGASRSSRATKSLRSFSALTMDAASLFAAPQTDWSAPLFLAVEGGSIGYQVGGASTDLILLFMNDHALHSLLSDKFKLGGDASVAAGPVGRDASAGTDLKLTAEILSYSRSKGIFAGVSLDGTVVHADKSGDRAMYGPDVPRLDIIHGKIPAPDPAANTLAQELQRYSPAMGD